MAFFRRRAILSSRFTRQARFQSPSLAKEIVVYSLADASSRLCQCAFLAVVNRLVISAGSMRFLPVVFAPQVVTALGISKGDVFGPAVSALRICACELPFSALMAFLATHLLTVDRVFLSFAGMLLEQFVLTALVPRRNCVPRARVREGERDP